MPTKLLKPSDAFAKLNFSQPQLDQPSLPTRIEQKCFGWRMGNFGLLLQSQSHKELSRIDHLCTLPHSPNWLLGFINQNANVVPVFALEPWLELSVSAEQRYQYALVMGQGKKQFAIALIGLPQKIDLTHSTAIAMPKLPDRLTPYIKDCCLTDVVWCQWDIHRFMDDLSQSLKQSA